MKKTTLLLSPFVAQKLGAIVCSENHEDMLVLKELIDAGKVAPVVDRTYPLAEAPAAIRYVKEGRARARWSSRCDGGRQTS